MTDTEREALTRRIDELCAEVERLRVANAAFTGRSIRAGDKMACLEAENAKLRELLSSYWKAVHCPATPNVTRDYLTEMHELGIEVPE